MRVTGLKLYACLLILLQVSTLVATDRLIHITSVVGQTYMGYGSHV